MYGPRNGYVLTSHTIGPCTTCLCQRGMSAGAWDAVQKHRGMILNVEQKHPTLGGRNSYILGEAVKGTGRASVEVSAIGIVLGLEER